MKKLMTLYYVDLREEFGSSTNCNATVWGTLTARFNSWCATQGSWAEWDQAQLYRKHRAELTFFQDLERKMAYESGQEAEPEAKQAYAIQHWRPSFDIMKEFEMKRAFTVPDLLLSNGQAVMASKHTQPRPLRLGGKGGSDKYRPKDNCREDVAKEQHENAEAKQRERQSKRTLIMQAAEADNKAADDRHAKTQKYIQGQSAADVAVKREMHTEMMTVLKALVPSAPSRDEKIAVKLRMLTEMSNTLKALDVDDVTRPVYQAQVDILLAEIRQFQAEPT